MIQKQNTWFASYYLSTLQSRGNNEFVSENLQTCHMLARPVSSTPRLALQECVSSLLNGSDISGWVDEEIELEMCHCEV